jgi:hypothetical protein
MKTSIPAFLMPAATAALALGYLGAASAAAITCPAGPESLRTATFDSAEFCETGEGNPDDGIILADFPPDAWTAVGELTDDGTSGYLTVELTSGSWGDRSIEGVWEIAASFWATYSEAVFSMHVGNGNGSPDYFAWLVTPGELEGTFSYENLGQGGGLSNVKLWGRGTPVPEPGALTLLGAGLAAVLIARRRRKAQ